MLDNAVDWFVERDGQFERLQPDSSGCYRSEVFKGLWLDPAALIRRDMAKVFEVVQQGLATAEHAQFVADLKAKSGA